jgi:hypothetical protein
MRMVLRTDDIGSVGYWASGAGPRPARGLPHLQRPVPRLQRAQFRKRMREREPNTIALTVRLATNRLAQKQHVVALNLDGRPNGDRKRYANTQPAARHVYDPAIDRRKIAQSEKSHADRRIGCNSRFFTSFHAGLIGPARRELNYSISKSVLRLNVLPK